MYNRLFVRRFAASLPALCFTAGLGFSVLLVRTDAGPPASESNVERSVPHVIELVHDGVPYRLTDSGATSGVVELEVPRPGSAAALAEAAAEEALRRQFFEDRLILSPERPLQAAELLTATAQATIAAGADGRDEFFADVPASVTPGGYLSSVEAEEVTPGGVLFTVAVFRDARVDGFVADWGLKRREFWRIGPAGDTTLVRGEEHPKSVGWVYVY